MRGRGQELGIELVIGDRYRTVEDFAGEVIIAANCRTRGGRWRFGKVGEREATRNGVEDIDPSSIGRRLIMDGSDELTEEMTIGRWARQCVGQDLDRVYRLECRLGSCEALARVVGGK